MQIIAVMSSSLLGSHDFDSGAQIDQVHPRTITNVADYKMGGMNTLPQTGFSPGGSGSSPPQ